MENDNDVTDNNNIFILYEDDFIVCINKPAGLLVHDDGSKKKTPTVVDWFLEYIPSAQGVGESGFSQQGNELNRSGIVHRLDRDTSGVLLLVKNQQTYEFFKKQFKDRAIKKEYRSLVYGRMKNKWGTINRPIGRSPRDFRLRSAEQGVVGIRREACTHWECLKTGSYHGEDFSYLKLLPKTGRMHQLRVHLKSIGRPIVGDVLYANSKMKNSNNLDLDRLGLHAFSLEFSLPDGSVKKVTVPESRDISEAIEKIAE
jgi:23S rRNA pseudouridine1911/1915/1917 synthase